MGEGRRTEPREVRGRGPVEPYAGKPASLPAPGRGAYRVHGVGLGWVVFLLAFFALPQSAQARERPYPTVVVLGYAQPLQTREGLPSPIVVVDHQSDGGPGNRSWSAVLRTTVLTLGLTWPLGKPLRAGVRLRGELITEGDGLDLYRGGKRLKTYTFTGDSLAGVMLLQLFPESLWRAELEMEHRQTRFHRTPDTASERVLPSDFQQQELRLRLRRQDTRSLQPASLSLEAGFGQRQDWRAWSLSEAATPPSRFQRDVLSWEQPWRWSGTHESRAVAHVLWGNHLDLFSGFRIGGFTGQYPVAGYFRNEYRARRAAVVNASHEWSWAEDRRVLFFADLATFQELSLPYLVDAPSSRTIAGIGLGGYYGLRALGGLPLILRYGEGLHVPAGSRQSIRREILLVVAAGF